MLLGGRGPGGMDQCSPRQIDNGSRRPSRPRWPAYHPSGRQAPGLSRSVGFNRPWNVRLPAARTRRVAASTQVVERRRRTRTSSVVNWSPADTPSRANNDLILGQIVWMTYNNQIFSGKQERTCRLSKRSERSKTKPRPPYAKLAENSAWNVTWRVIKIHRKSSKKLSYRLETRRQQCISLKLNYFLSP